MESSGPLRYEIWIITIIKSYPILQDSSFEACLRFLPIFDLKVDYATWFGGNVEYIHCIQMIPFTPISEELLRPEWVEEEYPVLAEAYSRGDLSEEWKVSSNTNTIT